MMRLSAAVCATLLLFTSLSPAGKFNKKLNIGDAAPTFANLPGTDGKLHSSSDYKDKDVLVYVVTCNECPMAAMYEDRIIDFAKKNAGPESKVGFVAINVSLVEEDKMPHMIKRAKEKGFPFPYVYDETQEIGRKLGATVTPEFFVIGKDRKIAYMGAMDDANNPEKATVHYLEDAVKAALDGKAPAKTETAARGCSLMYTKK